MWRGLFSQPIIRNKHIFLQIPRPGFFLRTYAKPSPTEQAYENRIREADREREKNAPPWMKRDQTLRKRYGAWSPTRKLSRQQITDIRDLKKRVPSIKTIQIANFFQINPESIRRILKSNWVPTEDELEEIEQRASRRKAESRERRKAEKELEAKKSSVVEVKSLMSNRRRQQQQTVKTIEERQRKGRQTRQSRQRRPLYSVGDIID